MDDHLQQHIGQQQHNDCECVYVWNGEFVVMRTFILIALLKNCALLR